MCPTSYANKVLCPPSYLDGQAKLFLRYLQTLLNYGPMIVRVPINHGCLEAPNGNNLRTDSTEAACRWINALRPETDWNPITMLRTERGVVWLFHVQAFKF
jgi:hypothetical protein